jgi:hypothetical protein
VLAHREDLEERRLAHADVPGSPAG